jgi:hypothetical protein
VAFPLIVLGASVYHKANKPDLSLVCCNRLLCGHKSVHYQMRTVHCSKRPHVHTGVAAAKDHDIGTTNLHIEASDVVNVLVYVGIAKGNGVLSKAGKEN